jgi:uncharacterized protein
MIQSKNNIIVEIKNTEGKEFAILNPISGSFDLLDENEYKLLKNLEDQKNIPLDFSSYLIERGYAYMRLADQEAAIEKAYNEFNDEITNSQVQLMLVPSYGCNLACVYCYQGKGNEETDQAGALGSCGTQSLISTETVDEFFKYAKKNFSDGAKKPFVTLFGGEPLINSPSQRKIIEYIIDKCVEADYEISAVTNGYDFVEYVDILKKAKIKEIQFTLDGSKEIHDLRRATANKRGTFDKIIQGIDAAVKNKIPVNLRSVVDIENIEDLINLAEYLDKKGWLDLPPELFKTQLGRNYELFDCYAKPQHLMTQIELWGKFAALSKNNPILLKFHRPDFKGIRHIVDTGEMYMASFDTCPACKTEWVFDLYGKIYGCTASCGRDEYLLGTFWPKEDIDTDQVNTWKSRNVKTIPKCRDCKYDVVCGGGCGVIAANHNDGNVLSPDCRPIQDLLDVGINHYIDDIKKMSATTENCMICGEELVYEEDSPTQEKCSICGNSFSTYVKCSQGHYVCDICHGLDALGKVEQLLSQSNEKNPISLAKDVFDLPGLNMHGPEYHSIVPAVLIKAYQNKSGHHDASKINEAINRGKDIKGGSCGLYGSCGACVGTGIAASIIEKATPVSKFERSLANNVTGNALIAISKNVGPRCCKREAITSIESFMQTTNYFSGMQKAKIYMQTT